MRLSLTLPLLSKELAEQSARRRTYILRTVYAAVLYGGALWTLRSILGINSSFASLLGVGGELFQGVLAFQFAAIYAMVPVLTAGVLTSEKERDTLGLLLITRLGPWTIVLQKYLSRVIPMLLYLLMSLPLLAMAYSLGGVNTGGVLLAGITLTVCVLQVASVAVFCSAWCRTTSQALIGTYVLLGLLFFVTRAPYGVSTTQFVPQQTRPIMVRGITGPGRTQMVQAQRSITESEPVLAVGSPWLFAFGTAGTSLPASSGLLLVSIYFFLAAARAVLWPRAFLRPRNRTLKFLQFIDRLMHRLNQNRFTKGKVLIREDETLPFDRPIAWRETSRRSFGTTRYLIRLLLAIEVPLVFWLILPLTVQASWNNYLTPPGKIEQWVVWWLGTMLILAQSTTLIAGERSRQTLDVLLSTPLSPRTMVREKFVGLWRLIGVLSVPLFTTAWVQFWWNSNLSESHLRTLSLPLLFFVPATVFVYWLLIAFVGFECGLWCRTQLQALAVSLAIVLFAAAAMVGLPHLLGSDWTLVAETLHPFSVDPSPGKYDPELIVTRMAGAGLHVAVLLGLLYILWSSAPRDFIRTVKRCEPA